MTKIFIDVKWFRIYKENKRHRRELLIINFKEFKVMFVIMIYVYTRLKPYRFLHISALAWQVNLNLDYLFCLFNFSRIKLIKKVVSLCFLWQMFTYYILHYFIYVKWGQCWACCCVKNFFFSLWEVEVKKWSLFFFIRFVF